MADSLAASQTSDSAEQGALPVSDLRIGALPGDLGEELLAGMSFASIVREFFDAALSSQNPADFIARRRGHERRVE